MLKKSISLPQEVVQRFVQRQQKFVGKWLKIWYRPSRWMRSLFIVVEGAQTKLETTLYSSF